MDNDTARLAALIDRIERGACDAELCPAVLKDVADWIRAAGRQVAASLAALDRLHAAVMLVGARADIAFANRAASVLLADGDGLRLGVEPGKKRLRLLAGHAATQARLDTLLRRAASGIAVDADIGAPLAVPRPSGLSPYVIRCSVLAGRNGGRDEPAGDTPRAILFVTDTARPLALDTETMTQLFGLTPGEARLVVELGDGVGLKEAADALGISLNTAKTQLQHVYQKTGVDNRVRLTKLLAVLAESRI